MGRNNHDDDVDLTPGTHPQFGPHDGVVQRRVYRHVQAEAAEQTEEDRREHRLRYTLRVDPEQAAPEVLRAALLAMTPGTEAVVSTERLRAAGFALGSDCPQLRLRRTLDGFVVAPEWPPISFTVEIGR
jgi:hypothetical protein